MNLPNYFDIIKTPMDLGTAKRKTEQGEYETEKEFVDDVLLVFQNAMTYNAPTNQVYIDASTLKEKFEKEFLGIEPPKPVEDAIKNPNKVAEALLQKLYQCNHSTIFREPVNPELYPDYYVQITNPIHLRRISEIITSSGYSSLQQFDDDIQLLFSNCYLFNKPGTFGYVAGIEFQTYYNKITKVTIFNVAFS